MSRCGREAIRGAYAQMISRIAAAAGRCLCDAVSSYRFHSQVYLWFLMWSRSWYADRVTGTRPLIHSTVFRRTRSVVHKEGPGACLSSCRAGKWSGMTVFKFHIYMTNQCAVMQCGRHADYIRVDLTMVRRTSKIVPVQ